MRRSRTVGMPSIRVPPPGLGISTFRTGCGRYCPRQQFFSDARPLFLQIALQGRDRHLIHAGRSLVGYYSRVCRHHVAATDYLLHQSRCRFRPVSCFPSRDVCRTIPATRGFRPLPSGLAPGISTRPSAAPVVIEIQGSCPLASCSALYRLVRPTPMASADFCQPIPAPLDTGSTGQVDRPPRVMRVTFIPYTRRIYSHTLRMIIGL